MDIRFRPYKTADLAALHAINIAGEPGVGALTQDALAEIISAGACLVAANTQDAPLGFLLTLRPDADYASKNYHWFDERYEDFIYVDRIAVAPATRGQNIGAQLYQHAFKSFVGTALLIGCEVNTAPPNPASLRFHNRLGFTEIGTQTFTPDYAVAYLARRLGV